MEIEEREGERARNSLITGYVKCMFKNVVGTEIDKFLTENKFCFQRIPYLLGMSQLNKLMTKLKKCNKGLTHKSIWILK